MRLYTLVFAAFVLAGTSIALPVERQNRFTDSNFLTKIETRAYDKSPELYVRASQQLSQNLPTDSQNGPPESRGRTRTRTRQDSPPRFASSDAQGQRGRSVNVETSRSGSSRGETLMSPLSPTSTLVSSPHSSIRSTLMSLHSSTDTLVSHSSDMSPLLHEHDPISYTDSSSSSSSSSSPPRSPSSTTRSHTFPRRSLYEAFEIGSHRN